MRGDDDDNDDDNDDDVDYTQEMDIHFPISIYSQMKMNVRIRNTTVM